MTNGCTRLLVIVKIGLWHPGSDEGHHLGALCPVTARLLRRGRHGDKRLSGPRPVPLAMSQQAIDP